MRAGLCSTQQGLTIEASTIVKQAISLAKRRGHSQVTPLHVASAMLASSTSLLRKACLQSHSHHPLQCKALELCFNVALNRLPTSTASTSFLSAHNYPTLPSLSNALVAAFKRAQAHQRRGSIENQQQQQQPILGVKIELEQLVVSMLDDPSVSRVMREAGLSSTHVKNKVEQIVPFEFGDSRIKENIKPEPYTHFPTTYNKSYDHRVIVRNNEDVTSVLNMLVYKRRSTIVVGESLSSVEGVVREVTDKFEKGFGDTKRLQFISLPVFSLRNLSREEMERKFMELRCLARSYMMGGGNRGIVLYLGDLKWLLLSDFRSSYQTNWITCGRSYVEDIIMELKRLVSDGGFEENGRLMIMGIANFETYSSCTTGNPSLESLLDLHPVTLPVANLNLSLNLDSDWSSSNRSKTNIEDGLTGETCDENYFKRASKNVSKSAEKSGRNDTIYNHTEINSSWSIDFEPKRSPKEYQFWVDDDVGLSDTKPDLLSNPNSTPNSTSSSETIHDENEHDTPLFDERNDENLNITRSALEKVVTSLEQQETIHEISTIVLKCRSRTMPDHRKQETLLVFEGSDTETKKNVAKELARVIFGAPTKYVSISDEGNVSSIVTIKEENISTGQPNRKRKRDESGCSVFERFSEGLRENPRRVFYIEDFDICSLKSVEQVISSVKSCDLKDAIVIFSCENFSSGSRQTSSPRKNDNEDDNDKDESRTRSFLSLDLNISIQEDTSRNRGLDKVDHDTEVLEYVDGRFQFNVREEIVTPKE